MPYLPLTLPPGFAKPGTVYDARGRWFDGNLVRWYDGVPMPGPWGGWAPLQRVDSPVSAAISDDGGVLTDETTSANDATADDVVLIPATPALNDAFYVGFPAEFDSVKVNVSTPATGGAVTWEYYNGTSWVALSSVVDGTVGFTVSGTNTVEYARPSDWATTTVNSQGPYFFIRARVSTAGTTTALGAQVWITADDVDVEGPIRGMLAWRDREQTPNLALGIPDALWMFRAGTLTDITPVGFTAGTNDATVTAGPGPYGGGAYGEGAYGFGTEGQSVLIECSTWQMDQFGQILVACAQHDGKLYWKEDPNTLGAATQITNSPTNCRGVVVTPERFVVALGASDDDRLLKWSDQADPETWTATEANQAGDLTLVTPGSIMAGRRVGGVTLIWTDYDVWRMQFIGGTLVYSILPVGSACGALSRHAMAVVDGKAFWMSQRGFFFYDGTIRPVPCEVSDYVFGSMNRSQRSKIAAYVRASFGEVVWHYPSEGSLENDRYVAFNYRLGVWTTGSLERTSGVDMEAFGFPIAADASGVVYQHEIVGGDHGTLSPFAESGPVEIGNGYRVMMVRQIIPEVTAFADVTMSIYASTYPVNVETLHGPFSLAAPTDTRLTGRQVRLRVDGVSSDWRIGTVRLEAVPGGRR